jgi:putative ubiquitin-RnfH superfamily antitoxin RatB of RatAB toxin-antitoxin module
MRVEIVYATPISVFSQQLELAEATTVAEAIARSSLLQAHPEIDFQVNKIGIFGKLVASSALLKDHDRIEIYRPLLAVKKKRRDDSAVAQV